MTAGAVDIWLVAIYLANCGLPWLGVLLLSVPRSFFGLGLKRNDCTVKGVIVHTVHHGSHGM